MMKCGYSKREITPQLGTPLSGFLARRSESYGIDTRLYVRAACFQQHFNSVVILAVDALGLSPDLADRIVATVAKRLHIDESCVVVAVTHTHSGPSYAQIRGEPLPADAVLADNLVDQANAAAERAQASCEPADITWVAAPASIGVNRRELTEKGVKLGLNSTGPTDKQVRALIIETPQDTLVIFNHACHPYCLGGNTSLISGDFCTHAIEYLESKGFSGMFLNGCAGNIAPVRAFYGADAAKAEGIKLAESIIRAMPDRERIDTTDHLSACSEIVRIPHNTIPELGTIRKSLNEPDKTVRDEERTNVEVRNKILVAWSEWLNDLQYALESCLELPPITARISLIHIGDTTIVALPGEVFFEIGEEIGRQMPAKHVMMVGYCHGYIGYIPTGEAYSEGGYEVEDSHKFVGLWQISPDAGNILTDAALKLLQ